MLVNMLFKNSISNEHSVTVEVTDICSLRIVVGNWDGASCPQFLLPFCHAVDALEKKEKVKLESNNSVC